MAYKDLRTYIQHLEEAGALHRIKAEVDWDVELGAVTRQLFTKKEKPALLFENVKDSKIPLLTGILVSDVQYGLITDTEPVREKILEHALEAAQKSIAPVMVESGPVHENVMMGDDVDLTIFPTPKWSELDGGRYIGTLGVAVTKDPDTGIRNLAVVREQLHSKNKTGINCEQHTGVHMRKYRDAGKPTPIATVIGPPPAVVLGGIYKAPYGVDEYDVAGALAGEPIPLVKCKTVDLEVPADAEIVIEGYIPPDSDEWLPEGPFGEFHGHYNDLKPTKRPTIVVTCVTYRNNPIFLGASPGVGPNECTYTGMVGFSASFKHALLQAGIPGVKDVNCTQMGCSGFVAVVQLSRHFYKGIPQACMHLLWSLGHHPKIVIVVDDDIDIWDDGMVQWAIGSRVQPHRDVIITEFDTWGCSLDPSVPESHRRMPGSTSSRMGIDATKFFKDDVKFSPLVKDSPEVVAGVTARWQEFGFTE